MNEDLAKRIRECPSLPSLPAIALQVLELAHEERCDIAEIARVISKDPALSSKILRTVNSSFYARSQRIGTISHALVLMGLQSVKTLVLGFSLVANLRTEKPKGFKHVVYWRRSIYGATAARVLSSRFQVVQQEECFLAALLKDIGMLVFDRVLGEEYGAVCEKATSHRQLVQLEQQAFGMTHADASALLAEHWKLPPVLVVPMSKHGTADGVDDPSLRKMTEIITLAESCADVFIEERAAEAIAEVRKVCQERHGMNEAETDALLDEVSTRTKEVAPLFEITLGGAANYEDILKKANEALVDLTLRSQIHAQTLVQQNKKLQVQAATDGLTGLANRATLDATLVQRFRAAMEGERTLSMLLIDVDHFKLVNDRHGHQAGDHVLRLLGKLLKGAARPQDLAARYGGEELCLLMPDTTKATAAAVAETIRRAVNLKPIDCKGDKISISISVGVATYEPGGPLREVEHLVRAADLAVYAAKHGGRNCVKVFAPRAA